MTWTPGPWERGEVIPNAPSTRIDANGEPVAWVYEDADARLIAAAPEMAALLDDWAAHGSNYVHAPVAETPHSMTVARVRSFPAEARALLARIRGEA